MFVFARLLTRELMEGRGSPEASQQSLLPQMSLCQASVGGDSGGGPVQSFGNGQDALCKVTLQVSFSVFGPYSSDTHRQLREYK